MGAPGVYDWALQGLELRAYGLAFKPSILNRKS